MKMTELSIGEALAAERLQNLTHPTPFLYMDLAVVSRQYQAFCRALPRVGIYYAIKCNPDTPLVRYILELGGHFEIASFPELEGLLSLGVKGNEVIFSNPVKIASHVQQAGQAGVYRFAFDSAAELEKIAARASGASVYLRLATTPAASTVPSEGKFGVDEEMGFELMQYAQKLDLIPYGIAFHVGSQMEDSHAWVQAIESSGNLMQRLRNVGIAIEMLDMGGGFPASYLGTTPDLAKIGQAIESALTQLPYQPQTLAIEPGRALVAEAGVIVASVIGIAQRASKTWVYLDVGAFNGLMEALETDNQLQFPLADSRQSRRQDSFVLTGPSCDSQDTILRDCKLSADISTGDKVFIYTTGAYTTSYASRFNGFDIPAVYYHHI